MQYSSKSQTADHALAARIFQAEGEIARLCREKEWAATPLGPVERWPASLRAAAGLVIAAPSAMIVLWGPELVQIYNDGYRAVMGKKHPAGLGQPTRECWPEVWEFNAPLYEGVINRRETFTFQDQALVIERQGHPEKAFFTLTYSPVLDDDGGVGGVLVTVVETTAAMERLRTEQAQRDSEERLRLALEAADLGTWDLDLVSDKSSSRSLRHDRMFGYQEPQAEWGREIASRHVLPEDRELFAQAFERAMETGVLSFEVRVRWPDGSIHWIAPLGRTYYDDQGRPVRMAGVVADVTEQNRMAALRESERRFRNMADAAPQIVWIADAKGQVEFFNRQWTAYTGRPFEPATVAEVAASVVHPDDVAMTMRRFTEAQGKGEAFEVEHRIRSASGDYRWFLVRAEPYRDPHSGQISRWFGASVDIHGRISAEAKLRKAAELDAFRVSLDNALRPLGDPVEIQASASRVLGQHLKANRVLYGEVSADGEHVRVEADYCDKVPSIVGSYRVEDFGPTLVADFRSGHTLVVNDVSDDPRLSAAEREATAALHVAAHTAVPLSKGGRPVAILVTHQAEPRKWTDSELAPMEETAERTWAAVQRAQAEKALRQSEAKYRMLFESMDQGFGIAEMLFDDAHNPVDFRWLETNPAFERHTGFVASETLTVLELIPDLEHYWVEIYGQVALTGEPARFVEASPRLDRWFDVYACPIGERERAWVAVLFTDVTERQQSEQAIQRANDRLIESDRRKDEFLAMLAHELRNPLAAISNTIKLLERRSPPLQTTHESPEASRESTEPATKSPEPAAESPEPAAESPEPATKNSQRYLDILNRQTNMLRGLVDDLLDVSRITRGLIELKLERVDLNAVAERGLESVQPFMDEKGHEVSVTLPRKPLKVIGDPVRLEQILANLLTNAAKYTDPGGRITLCLERNGENADLHVSDTGIGMSKEVLERIFELFGQAERGLARSEGGLGIGLTIVKNLVELHNGLVEAKSEGPGQGAEFTVSLPLANAEPTEATTTRQEPAPPVRSRRVLVVEDSKDIAETMVLLLEASDHDVAVAHDGPTALKKAERFGPEVILLDIGLPDMDGYEIARRLRQNPRTRSATLVALTGYGQAEDIKRAKAAGFDKHFTKPVAIEALEDFINGLGA